MLSRLRGTLSHNLRIEGRGTEERQTAMIGSRVSKLMEHILHMEMIFKLCLLRKAKGVLENWWGRRLHESRAKDAQVFWKGHLRSTIVPEAGC